MAGSYIDGRNFGYKTGAKHGKRHKLKSIVVITVVLVGVGLWLTAVQNRPIPSLFRFLFTYLLETSCT